eukprot:9421379-Pyramimonas_sp.AAC.1
MAQSCWRLPVNRELRRAPVDSLRKLKSTLQSGGQMGKGQCAPQYSVSAVPVSYTHLRAHETGAYL